MSITPPNISVRAPYARPDAPQTPRPTELAPPKQVEERSLATRPAAVADTHRVERPIPDATRTPAPRGSIVNLVV